MRRICPLGQLITRDFIARRHKRSELFFNSPFEGNVFLLAWVVVAKRLAEGCEMGDSGGFCTFEESVGHLGGFGLTLDWFHILKC